MLKQLSSLIAMSAAALAITIAPRAAAGSVTLDFEEFANAFGVARNLTSQGFRLSPRCHFDFQGYPVLNATGKALGYDSAGCDPADYVANSSAFTNVASFLGAALPNANQLGVYIDRNGGLFDLLSLSFFNSGVIVYASSGAQSEIRSLPPGLGGSTVAQWYVNTFNGPEWKNLSWIAFRQASGGAPTLPIDNIVLNTVPTPSALWVLVAAGLAFGAVVRSRKT